MGNVAIFKAILLLIWLAVSKLCSATVLNFEVEEEQPIGHQVGSIVLAADFAKKYHPDEVPSILRFSFLESSPHFGIDTISSEIRTLKKLDRELLCVDERNSPCVILLDVFVNPNVPEHFQMIKVQITILDINDNSPLFPMPKMDLYIPEGLQVNASFYLPTAEDLDSDVNGVAEYELRSHTRAFRINTSIGQYGETDLFLVLTDKLDREVQGAYTLELLARDYGQPSRSGSIILNVTVGDENDNKPHFSQPIYSVRVPESAKPGIMLTRVIATDQDSGLNGQLKYSIRDSTSSKIKRIFRMNEETGELFLRQMLDYEEDKSFLIPIRASDSGVMPQYSQTIVNVSIADENDNYPAITVRTVGSNSAQVREHSPNGTFVAHVRVEDHDSGSNGLVTCLISSPYLQLRQSYLNEYNLVVNAALDRETNKELNVTIFCSDGGSPQRVGKHQLIVTIMDVNDQEPAFDRFVYYVEPIEENNDIGAPIVQVKAVDKDIAANAELQYELGDEFDATYFAINKLSGLITARTSLDREDKKDYTFSVLAIDKGVPPLTATAAVYVTLKDVNDNSPVFNMSYYQMSVAENMPKYSFVGKVDAYDRDIRANGDIWFRMVNASRGPFIIEHDTGIIYTRTPLDRERIGGGRYQVVVVAADYGMPARSAKATITIDVIDENDNIPIITSGENATFTCSYQTPVNITIGTVIAYDADTGDNGKLGYFIQSGNQYGMFGIKKLTGEVTVAKKINPEMVGYYRLEIGVQDNGLSPNTVVTNVGVDVTTDMYIPADKLTQKQGSSKPDVKRTYNVNLIVVIVLSSTSAVLSLILIAAIIRIKRQTKENHSYNCRTEAQKLFNSGRSSELSQPSCGSSWGAISTTDRSSVFSRVSSATECDAAEPLNSQTFLTTFTNGSPKNPVIAALKSYDKNNLAKHSLGSSEGHLSTVPTPASLQRSLNKAKEPDSDSGNCDDVCSVHNSTPQLSHNACKSSPNILKSFQSKFLSTTGVEQGIDHKVPSSISSGNNSMNTNSSQNGSPATSQNTSHNHKQKESSIASGPKHSASPHHPPPPQESGSDNYPAQNTSEMSDQTINGERLCAHIDDLFFSDIL
ncbi:protocadherin beta-10-like isoform X2 [Watersipora subatra]|uniref:protocadherin beta-10-like isoform X2 n=1 Tax=Watersipora subatra TaxID=2589382 RepID=UPI00355C5AC5